VNDPAPRGLVPPCPNLGPEPWRESRSLGVVPILVLAVLVCLVLAWFLWRRHRRVRARGKPRGLASGDQSNTKASPHELFVALSDAVREGLTLKFGTGWRAKTTEELSTDAQLEQLIGPQDLHELIRFLDQVDRLKFASKRSNHDEQTLQEELIYWRPRIVGLEARIRAKPRGRWKLRSPDSDRKGDTGVRGNPG